MFSAILGVLFLHLAVASDNRCTIYDGGCAFHVVLAGSNCSPKDNHMPNSVYGPASRLRYASQTRESYEAKEDDESVAHSIKSELKTTIARMDDLESRLITALESMSERTLRHFRKIKNEIEEVRMTLQAIDQKSSVAPGRPPRSPKCPQGFESIGDWNSCYMLSKLNTTFLEAEEFCDAYGSRLVSIENVKEAYVLDSLVESQKDFKHVDKWWTSAKYIPINQQWMWTSPTMLKPMLYTRWAPGEPNGRSTSHCMVMHVPNAFDWTDAICTETHHFICEIEAY